MTLTCSSCKAEVPEGADKCPSCGAGLSTVMFGKRKGLTKTLIGKAVELRDSIPWASASAVVVLRDPDGKRRARPGGVLGTLVVVAVLIGGGYALSRSKPTAPAGPQPVPPAPMASEPPAPLALPPLAPLPSPAPPATAKAEAPPRPEPPVAKPASPPPASPPAAKGTGTLVVKVAFKGKAVPAKVMVNGENKGNAPVTLALAPSKYTLTVEKSGY